MIIDISRLEYKHFKGLWEAPNVLTLSLPTPGQNAEPKGLRHNAQHIYFYIAHYCVILMDSQKVGISILFILFILSKIKFGLRALCDFAVRKNPS
jgi:hypothetical protein